ncbi:MAG: hypothetical protein CMH83_20155 [Nocardioides sp.]|nr:hypothetical protein [Nocardioides sp.]
MTASVPEALVEREEQLAALTRWAADAAAGSGRVVVVRGEAGIGKTSLVDRLVAGAVEDAPTARWSTGRCDVQAARRPLAPWHDLAGDLGPGVAAALEADDRTALFAAVLGAVRAPLPASVVRGLVVEDVHWADDASLDLVEAVARRVVDAPVMLVLTCREDDEDVPDQVRTALGEIVRLPASRRLDVPRLSRDGVAALTGADTRDPGVLHDLTGGNPFFLVELLRSPGAEAPPSVRDVVLGQVAGLDAEVREELDLAAVAGDRLLRDAEVREAVLSERAERDLVRRGLLVDGDRLRFRHEITRQTVVHAVPGRRRTALHRRLLETLDALGSDDHALLAAHASGAGDRGRTLHHARLAAERAGRVGSVRAAVRHYRQALAAATGEPDGPTGRAGPVGTPEVVAPLEDGLARAHGLLNEHDDALAARRRGLDHWERLGDPVRLARALSEGCWIEQAAGRSEEAEQSVRRAIALLQPLGPSADLVAARTALSRVLGLNNRLGDALEHVRAAQQDATVLARVDLEAELLNIEACCLALLGERWEDVMADAVARAAEVPDDALVGRARYNECCLLLQERRLSDLEERLPSMLAHAEEHHLEAYVSGLRRARAIALLHLGRWDEALEEASSTAEPDSTTEAERHVVRGLVAVRRGTGGTPGATPDTELDQALELAERSGQPQLQVPARLARAEAAWLAGDADRAAKEVARARDLHVEQVDLARDVALWAHRIGIDPDGPAPAGPAGAELAGRARAAADGWDALGCRYDAALALLGSDDVEDVLRAVRRLEALGAVVPARLARRRARDLGARSVPPEPRASTRAHPAGLTSKELEVLELVAQGLRNADVAERLFLSPKTVAVHLTSVYRKLGVLGRGEAAAWAREHRPSTTRDGTT